MKVILKEDVFKLGSLGDEVDVKPGYARNYLIPQGKALPFTRSNVKQINHMKNLLAKERADAIAKAQALADKLAEKSPLVLRKMKEVANQSMDQSQEASLRHELLMLRDHLRSYDIQEGLAAFGEKRKPEFKGK